MAVLAQDLRDSVLQAAVSGKLTQQLDSDSSVDNILESSKKYKEQVFKDFPRKKKIKLTAIVDEDCPDIDLPKNWKFVKLGQILTTFGRIGFRGYTTNDLVEKGNGAITLSPSNFDWFGKLNFDNNTYISWEKYEESPEIKLKNDDIVIVKTGSSYGKLTKIKDLPCETTINPQLAVLKYFDLSILDYLIICLRSSVVQKQIEKIKNGTSIPTFPLDKFENIIIPLAPIEEQARIVAKVEEIMQKIDEYEKIEKQLEEIKKAFPIDMRDALLQAAMQGKLTEQLDTDSSVDDLIEQIKAEREKLVAEGKIKKSKGKKSQQNDYFVDLPKDEYPYDIPENWKITNIQNICTLYTGNSISESIKKSKYTNLKEGYNYIGTKDVEFNRTITYENGVKIPFSEEKFVYSYPNSTLLCIEGGSAGRKIAITKEKVCFGNKLCTFNPISINYKFLYYYLQSPLFLSAFNNSLSGIITGVSLNKIKELNIVIPPIEEQQRIVETLDRLLPLCEAL